MMIASPRVRPVVLAVIALLGASGTGAAQGTEPPPRPAGAAKTVQRYATPLGCERMSVAEGLPHSNVLAVVQDTRGFMWLGTQDGLARYDGIRTRIYRPLEGDKRSISSGHITALAVDAAGRLWAGTAEHGVNLYDPSTDKFTRYGKGEGGLSSEGVTAIARDAKDRLWFAMSGGGLNSFDAASGTFTEHLGKPLDAAITAIYVDPSGALWLGTAADGVIRWDPDGKASATYLPEDLGMTQGMPVTSIVRSGDKLWIGSDGDGLIELDPASRKFVQRRHDAANARTLTDDHVSALFEDQDKNLWIGTTNGLNRLSPDGTWVRFQHSENDPTSLPFFGVESMFQDGGGVMWVGGFTVGLCKFDAFRQKLGFHRTQNLATSFFEDADGTLWAGTYNDGLYKYERKAQRLTVFHELRTRQDGQPGSISLKSGTWISALHRDRRGTLWLSLKGRGLVAFDSRAEPYREYSPNPDDPRSIPTDSIFDIHEDELGRLWLASWGSGLVRFDPESGAFTTFRSDGEDATGLSSNHIYTLQPDPADKKYLWLGTAKGGLVRFDLGSGTGKAYRHNSDDPTTLSSDDVMTVHVDKAGIVWLGTYGGGLNRLDPSTGKAERFTTSNSALTNDGVLGLLADDDGKLWMSTNGGGLLQFEPTTKTFVGYEQSDGLQDNEFNQGSYMRSKGGEMFFGGQRGFNAFFPKQIERDRYAPPVAITAFKLFNHELTLDRPIWTLPEVEVTYADSFEVEFAALAFAAPKKNRYAYKLEGFDSDFIETDRPYATYTKLDGGTYTLRVRAANRHGVWTEKGIALTIAVRPPWWRTWQAFLGYLVLLAGSAYLLFRYQRERLRRAEREGRLAIVERDLELTGAVQTGFLPEHNEINSPRLQVYGLYRPADACGGDWWWHDRLSGNRHVVMVGDVTGHGPGPAMVTAAVATAWRVLIETGIDDVEQGLAALNREVLRVAKGKYHMTMAALEINEADGTWTFYSAGAPPIMSLDAQAKHRVHFCPGAPLGTENGFEVGRVSGQLSPGDRMLMYTDGIPEIALPNGNSLGLRRFAQLYERTREQALRDAASTIVTYADQSRGAQPQLDDWTFTILEWGDGRAAMPPA